MTPAHRLPIALLLLRLTVFLVMLVWTIDKFINPDHAAKVFEHFYFIGGVTPGMLTAIGVIELLIIGGFVAGVAKTWTYGFVLLVHAVSTLSSFPVYLSPFEGPNLLFFAAWPMLAACLTLFLLRSEDRIATLT